MSELLDTMLDEAVDEVEAVEDTSWVTLRPSWLPTTVNALAE